MSTCCCCASYLRDSKLPRSPTSEKPLAFDRHLDCCGRTICAACQYKNRRFETYCPFCQISSEPSALPQNGLRLPPAYTKTDNDPEKSLRSQVDAPSEDAPPPYSSLLSQSQPQFPTARSTPSGANGNPPSSTPDTIHHLSPTDSLSSLSLAYNVPLPILRQHNALFTDSLLMGRKYILIPASHYTGPSLSQPPDPAEEERKNKIRRFMVQTKCSDYAVAELYLRGAQGEFEVAVESYRGDEEWERRNPLKAGGKGKGKGRRKSGNGSVGGGLVGQLS
jgi:hypothetical protein